MSVTGVVIFFMLRPDHSYLYYFDESNYFAIQVYEAEDVENARILALDNLVHSYVPSDDATRLIYDYETVYAAITDRVAPAGAPLRSLFIGGGEEVYCGMILGEHNKGQDLEVNPLKAKQLTNFRAAGKDDAVKRTTPIRRTLEEALAYIQDDERVEVTPKSIRLRKSILDPHERKREKRKRDAELAAAG